MKKIKLPKRLAGIKVPKTVRKGVIAGFANSATGQQLLVEALAIAATASARSDDAIDEQLASAMRAALVTFREALGVDPDAVVSFRTGTDRDTDAGPPADLAAPD